MKSRFNLHTPALAGGREAESQRSGYVITRSWLFDWPVGFVDRNG
jgi:hypothetical protein